MKLEKPINDNYCAVVVRLANIVPLAGCDNVVGTTIFGNQAIVSKDSKIGDVGIVFPAETQLSDKFCSANDLYRHAEFNKDKTKAGYMEDNRRVKAIKFRGHVSSCLFTGLESLASFGVDPKDLDVGDSFDFIGKEEVCRKYVNRQAMMKGPANTPKCPSRVESLFFPLHCDTSNYFRNKDLIGPKEEVVATAKLHGSSIRIAHTYVRRRLSVLDRIAKILGAKIQEFEHAYVFGSRQVTKDANDPRKVGFYDADIWSIEGKKLEGLIPENFVVFGEILGFTPSGKAIQGNYTYDCAPGECSLYVYRVAFVNPKGFLVDLSWGQVKAFCTERGLKHVPELWKGKHEDFKPEDWLEKRFKDCGFLSCPKLSKDGTVDEGVVIRAEGIVPTLLKAKSQGFLLHETKMLDDAKAADLESEQAVDETLCQN